MNQEFVEALGRNPAIAATFDFSDLEETLVSSRKVVFLLSRNICELKELIHRVHAAGKKIYIYIDLLEGVANDRSAIQFLKAHFYPDGIITTKAAVTKHAREEDVFAIQRFFLLDFKSYETVRGTVKNGDTDATEILPGILPEITYQVSQYSSVSVIVGGLIRAKKDTMDSLATGAMGASVSRKTLWNM